MAKQTTTLQGLMESEAAKKLYRDEYNTRPNVQARRKLYNQLRLDEAKIARKVIKGDLTVEAANKALDIRRKQYDKDLAELNGLPDPSRAQASTNNGS